MEQYGVTGGLEPNSEDRREPFIIDGTEYILTDKFKTMLRDSFIDWGSFLQVYNDTLDSNNMFNQIVKLLNIKENENLREMMIPLLKKIHGLPAQAHLTCMMKQFMLYEPVSIAIQAVFSDLKYHYEAVVHMFVDVRNAYIKKNKLRVKANDWDKLVEYWSVANDQHDFDSSSIILLMLNPPKKVKHKIHTKTPGLDSIITPLNKAIKKFQYPGFCPKVPHTRLTKLLKFPINEFAAAINKMDPSIKLPDYKTIEKSITGLLTLEKLPDIPDKPRTAPKSMTSDTSSDGKLNLAKWYVNSILEYRKGLLQEGHQLEEHYITMAKKLNLVHDIFKKELTLISESE